MKLMVELLMNLIGTTFGVWLGLFLSRRQENRSDDAVNKAIVDSLHAEAEANEEALDRSFKVYVATRDLVFNEFRVEVALNSLANPLFLRKAKPSRIKALNKYVRHLSLANNYGLMARQLATSTRTAARSWEDGVYGGWKRNLQDCKTSIGEIRANQ